MTGNLSTVPSVVSPDRRGNQVWLSWDNGPRNLLDLDVVEELTAQLREADSDSTVEVVVLTGADHTFCGGADLPKLRRTDTAEKFAHAVVDLLKLLPKLRTPSVALVRGDALASGFALALLADVTVAVDGTKMGTVEVASGSWPMIAQVPVRHFLPAKLALQNITTGVPFTSDRLAELGVISETAPPNEAERRAYENARALSAATKHVASGKALLADMSVFDGYEADLDAALASFVDMLDSQEQEK